MKKMDPADQENPTLVVKTVGDENKINENLNNGL